MDPPKRVSLGYSLKNIPLPTATSYKKRMIEMVESVIKRMRWRAFFFLRGDGDTADDCENRRKFGLKSRGTPPQIEEMKDFEDDLAKMIERIEFRKCYDSFQNTLRKDVDRIKKSKEVFVPADKTRNLYEMDKAQYKKLLHDNITRHYQSASEEAYEDINMEAGEIAAKLQIADRMETMARKEAFLTLKDHKEHFEAKLPCRLINPAKSEMGIVSKQILDAINQELRRKLCLTVWRNSTEVVGWFKKIMDKEQCTFTCFDIVEFYPSISKDLLEKALDFAKQHTPISDEEINIIYHSRKSLLFDADRAWMKNDTGLFDVTMGSFDGAEVCELVGTFALAQISQVFGEEDVGLYRDDGLAVSRGLSGSEAERAKKDVTKLFKQLGLRITIQTNLKIANFLDVTLNLSNGKYYPYRKPNDQPMYINRQSNHPHSIVKNIPDAVSRRITALSHDRAVFDQAAPLYNDALRRSGFTSNIRFDSNDHQQPPKVRARTRRRKITWFNPPYSKNVKTNVGKKFLSLIDRHFPAGSKLRKIFNRNTIKVSYSCMPNIGSIIKHHNAIVLKLDSARSPKSQERACNCRKPEHCPLKGDCLANNIVYKAIVSTDDCQKEYIGSTEPPFKQRYYNHTTTFRHEHRQNATELSKYVWQLKRRHEEFNIDWVICTRAQAYRNGTKRCNLCLTEKLCLINADRSTTLNKRSELASKCRHENKFYLSNFARTVK